MLSVLSVSLLFIMYKQTSYSGFHHIVKAT